MFWYTNVCIVSPITVTPTTVHSAQAPNTGITPAAYELIRLMFYICASVTKGNKETN